MMGRGINDDRRHSSMMPPKRTGNGASGEMRKMNLLTQTTIINYSIIMRSVNANLLAINQAKKEGKTPALTSMLQPLRREAMTEPAVAVLLPVR